MESRLAVAKSLGADETLLVTRECTESQIVQKIHNIFGEEPDKTIDASGAQSSIRAAILVSPFSSFSLWSDNDGSYYLINWSD